jgi:prefoldin subunit 5
MGAEEWKTSIQDIDDAIEELKAKVARIRKRIDEVKDLRTGVSHSR